MVRKIKLREIYQDGSVTGGGKLAPKAKEMCQVSAAFYNAVGVRKPWISYLAFDGEIVVGTGSFKGAPQENGVEISYTMFEESEGKGYDTAIVTSLIRVARQNDAKIRLYTHTVPKECASTEFLRKLNFQFVGDAVHPKSVKTWE